MKNYKGYSRKQWKRKIKERYERSLRRVHDRLHGDDEPGFQDQDGSDEDITDTRCTPSKDGSDMELNSSTSSIPEDSQENDPTQTTTSSISVSSDDDDEEDVWLDDTSCNVLDDYDSVYRYSDADDDFEDALPGLINAGPDEASGSGFDKNPSVEEESSDDEDAHKLDASGKLTRKISKSLREILTPWAIENNIPHAAMSKLLHGIRSKIPEVSLPLDPRTLFQTKRKTVVERLLLKVSEMVITVILAWHNVSEKNLWPILCSDNIINDVFIIGVYAGESKPKDANEFLRQFIDETVELEEDGIIFNDSEYTVFIDALVCDTPAKAFILKVKGHMGYFSCTKCEIEGENIDSVCFPGPAATPRTDEKFKNNEYSEDYQQGETELNKVRKLGLVSGVPLDPMHLVFIGVMKKFLRILMFVSTMYRLSAKKIEAISERLKNIKNSIPCDFARKTRELRFVDFYKATELRQFLLYSGMIALRGIVHPDVYTIFLTLHVAISILSHPSLSKDASYLDYAEKLLKKFVGHFQRMFGAKYVSFNVHGLLHLANDVRKYGQLENFSAFRFENFIGKLKKMIRMGNQPLQQIMRRSDEIERLLKDDSRLTSKSDLDLVSRHADGPLIARLSRVIQYKQAHLRSFQIKCDDKEENCLLIDEDTIVEASNIVKTAEDEVKHCYWSANRITAKMCRLPYENQYVVIPLLHTYAEKI
ncbi:hypothetical protein QAD02_020562 [Eretmocerus hayati]|uniref:Uncharacterized protein n=1 Tax=Eretmocerus hayati TaxID=131215 RepID=A0ACC2PQ95_9HYME|nr:hypothetical protein QAD02_020562 [Eretmocerus hayati]